MIDRHAVRRLKKALAREAAVALIGPRQVGKTTLALEVAQSRGAIYLDLESQVDRDKLTDPHQFLSRYTDKLVILDEIHRAPALFEALRGLIDQGRRSGQGTGRFLLLGSASIDLMRQSETLAGRIEYVDLGPLNALEVDVDSGLDGLWLRGGFPRSFLAEDDETSFERRQNFIRTYLERDVPMFAPRVPAETLRRFWTMLAHSQGGLLNASNFARSLSVTSPTVSSYIDLLVDLLLVRRLSPYHSNVKKRLVKSPKVYVRDSGLVHALLGVETMDDLLGHPVSGASWEGLVIESLIAAAPVHAQISFFKTAAGAEIDLLLELGGKHGTWAVEIKRGLTAKVERGFHVALEDVQPSKAFVVYGGTAYSELAAL